MSPRHCFKHTVSVNILSQEVVLLLTGEEVRLGAVQELAQKCWDDNTGLSDPSAAEDGLPDTTACRSEMRPQTSLKPRTVLMCLPSGRMENLHVSGYIPYWPPETSCFFCYLHFHVF